MISILPKDIQDKIGALCRECAERKIGLVIVGCAQTDEGTACNAFCNLPDSTKGLALDMAKETIDQALDHLSAETN